MAISIGRRGRVYVKQESTYGTFPSLAATDAMRHQNAVHAFDPFNRVTSTEKKDSPGAVTRFDRKKSASLSSLEALVRPSGTLNTVSEADELLEAALGAKTNITHSSTVQASPAPTASVFTIGTGDVATAGYVVGDAILITVTGQSGPFVRVISAIATDALTVEPDLPAAPASGDAVKGCITYKLTTGLAISMAIAKFMPSGEDGWAIRGCGIDRLRLAFDEAQEPTLAASGPGMDVLTTGASGMPTDPSTFTTVGNNPPSGLTGHLRIDNGAYLFRSAEIEIVNGLAVRNTEYGVNAASELYRRGRREVSVSLDAWAETAATLYALAEAGTNVQLLLQTGLTEGNIVAVYCPKVEFKVPTLDDPDEEVTWSYAGMALETADALNDELALVLA